MFEAKITRSITARTVGDLPDYIADMIMRHFGLSVDIQDQGESISFTLLSPNMVVLGTAEFYDFDEFPIGRGFGARTGVFLEDEAGGELVKVMRRRIDTHFPRKKKDG